MKTQGIFTHEKHSSTSKIGSRSPKCRARIRRTIKRGERNELTRLLDSE